MKVNLKNCAFLSVIKKLTLSNLCLSCGSLLKIESGILCINCLKQVEPTNLGNWIHKLTSGRYIDSIYSAWFYNGIIQDLIHDLKYNGEALNGKLLGKMAGEVLRDARPDTEALLPVPLNSVRRRERGYNQAEWIAKGLSCCWNVNVNSKILKRTKNTVSQTSLKQSERVDNMKGAFKYRGDFVPDKVCLVDDVATTGSTVSSCAEVLKKNGVKSVTVITVATPKLDP